MLLLAAVCTVAAASEQRLERGGFVIDYTAGQERVAAHTLEVLEQAVREFAPMLPPGDRPVYVKIIATADEFEKYAARFHGLDVSGLARPGEDLIVVKAPRLRMPGSDYPGTLRHELVHLLLYRNVNPAYLPQWLNEGIAMSLANEFRWQSMFSVARMFIQNRIIPYHKLDRAFFAPSGQQEFGDAYAQALSMTRFLRDSLGEERFWRVVRALRDMPFHDALRSEGAMTSQAFWDAYQRSLWKYAAFATMASGFFFQPAAILLIIAYLRRRRIAQGIYRRWEEEEEAAAGTASDRDNVVYWDEVVDDPDAWKDDPYEDEDDDDW